MGNEPENWQRLTAPDIAAFIAQHQDKDPAALALRAAPDPGWPWPDILRQIQARQKAHRKLPSWHARAGIIFPAPDRIEQASSEATALYKAALCREYVREPKHLVDLSAGTGMDLWAMAGIFEKASAVEHDAATAAVLAHNLRIMGRDNVDIRAADSAACAASLMPCDLAYIDPQRRGDNTKGRFDFAECSPDIARILPALAGQAERVMIKASPFLDIENGLSALQSMTRMPVIAVHVVEWQGSCREILFVLDGKSQNTHDNDTVPIMAAIIDDNGKLLHDLRFTRHERLDASQEYRMPEKYLYEPSPAFQKAEATNILASAHDLHPLHPHTHLLTSAEPIADFPGRAFAITGVYPLQAGALPFAQANVSVRNLPMSAEDLRRKLKLKDGGGNYVFGCTLCDGKKALIAGVKF